MNFIRLSIVFVLAMLVTNSVQAQDGRRDRPPERNREQRDGDGQRQRRDRERPPERISPLMAALDTDKNGILSAKEIAAAATTLKTLDKNKDGSIQPEELRPSRGRGDRRGGGEAGADSGQSNPFVDRIMGRDANADGKVSKEEAGEQMARFFGNIDADKDGFLTKAEVTEMSKRFQRGGGRRGGGGGEPPKSKENRPDFDGE
jgi:Ca2+-binding EF-hand superfamily protein